MSVIQADNTSNGFFAGFNRRTEHLVSSTFNVPVIKNQILFVTAKPVTLRMNYGALFTTVDLTKILAAADGEISVSGYSVPAGTTTATIPDLSGLDPIYKEAYQITAESNLYSARIVHNFQDSALEAGTFIFVVEIKNYIHIPPQLKSERLIVIDAFYLNGSAKTDSESYYMQMMTQVGSIGTNVLKLVTDGVKTNNSDVIAALGTVKTAIDAVTTAETANGVILSTLKTSTDTISTKCDAIETKLDTLHIDLGA